MEEPTGHAAYRAARDMLVRHRDDFDAAVAAFRWPDVGDRFNWALDWFDPVAAGNPQRRCASSMKTGPIGRTPSPTWPRAPIGSPHRWPKAASRPAIVSWSCWAIRSSYGTRCWR